VLASIQALASTAETSAKCPKETRVGQGRPGPHRAATPTGRPRACRTPGLPPAGAEVAFTRPGISVYSIRGAPLKTKQTGGGGGGDFTARGRTVADPRAGGARGLEQRPRRPHAGALEQPGGRVDLPWGAGACHRRPILTPATRHRLERESRERAERESER
jgi:hypothetical protein